MNRTSARLLSFLLGLLVGGANFVFLVPDVGLSGALVLFYAIGTRLLLRFDARLANSGDRSVGMWAGAFAGLLTLGATVGVGPMLPISTDLRFALGLLVLGVGATSFGLGAGMAFAVVEQATSVTPAPDAD